MPHMCTSDGERFTRRCSLLGAALGLSLALSACTNVTSGPPAATNLAFSVQPTNTNAGAPITPAVEVQVEDAAGRVVSSFGGTISVVLEVDPNGATLSGTTTAIASNGRATFANLALDRAGTGYTLRATATGMADAVSNSFAVPGHNMTVLYSNESAGSGPGTAIVTWLTPEDAIEYDTLRGPGGGTWTYRWYAPGFRTDTVYPYQRSCVHFVVPNDSVTNEYLVTWSTGSWMSTNPGAPITTWYADTAWGFDGSFLLPVGTSYNNGQVMQGC